MDDEIAKWRAERRANYPSAKKDKTESSEPEKVRNTKRRNDKHELNLHDKVSLIHYFVTVNTLCYHLSTLKLTFFVFTDVSY